MISGLGMILYPSIANFVNSYTQSKAIATYIELTEDLSNQKKDQLLKEAYSFNADLFKSSSSFGSYSSYLQSKYSGILDISGTGIIGYINIPSIDVHLSIYHGTTSETLQVGIGHLEGSSLPVGGENTHSVLSGHTGLPSAKLFTDIDQLQEGDIFSIHVLDEVLTYEVDQVEIVLPDDMNLLSIEEGKDLVTLVTCTPYGVNSHRLLVRGHRVPTITGEENETLSQFLIENNINPIYLAGIGIIIIVLIALVLLWIRARKNKGKMKVGKPNIPLPKLPDNKG